MDEAEKKFSWFQWVLVAVIILLSIEVVFLVKQNADLETALSYHSPQAQPNQLMPGDTVEPFTARTLAGSPIDISYNDPNQKYLLFIFTTTCLYCENTLGNWGKITSSNENQNCIILGISIHDLERTQQYSTTMNVGFYVTSVSEDTSFNRKYKITGYPATVLIRGDASVEKVWIGQLNDEQTEEIITLIRG